MSAVEMKLESAPADEISSETYQYMFDVLFERAGKPSIGRVVHYHPYGTPGGEYKPATRAAIVTAIGGLRSTTSLGGPAYQFVLGLCVLNPTGMFFNESVPFSPTPKPGHWSWPPRE